MVDVQYFKFDQQGNMFIYGPGVGFSGDCKFVAPGDELKFDEKVTSQVDVTVTQGFECA